MSCRAMASSTTDPLGALGHVQQKCRDALKRVLPPEQEQMLLGLAEPDHGQIEQVTNDARRAGSRPQVGSPFIGDDFHRRDRFGGGVVQIADLEAEHVAWRYERR